MPTFAENANAWVRVGDKVKLRDGRLVVITDAFDQTHEFVDMDENGPVKIAGESDDICLGHLYVTEPKLRALTKRVAFSSSEIVSIIR